MTAQTGGANMDKPVTLERIEREGAALPDATPQSYLAVYSIINPWTLWIFKHDPALLERRSVELAGWREDVPHG